MIQSAASFHDQLIARWARAGAMFAVEPAREAPDLELLLLDTARAAPGNSRLFIMAVSWLDRYAPLIAKHRLRRMVIELLEIQHRAVLGLMLDIVRHGVHTDRFNGVIEVCQDCVGLQSRPLFDVQAGSETLRRLAEQTASDISRRWGLYVGAIEIKRDAIRPPLWVMQQNPEYRDRAEFKGDLRCSILLEIARDPSAGASEVELARRCGVTRAAVRASLASLELAGRVERLDQGLRRATVLRASI